MHESPSIKFCLSCGKEGPSNLPVCIHCGQRFVPFKETPWYFRPSFILMALLSVGPLALPIVWLHPQSTRITKIIITLTVVIISWYLWNVGMHTMQGLLSLLKQSGYSLP